MLARAALVLAIVPPALASALAAQCALQWQPGDGIPGANDHVHTAIPWDPDGSGPAPMRIVLGGAFTAAGSTACDHVVAWDPATSTFAALGSGVNGTVRALTVAANGDLVVGGAFSLAGGVAANNIATWNGTTWSPLGAGVGGEVRSLLASGADVIAGGAFTTAGGSPASLVARWDGAAWSAMGTGLQQAIPFHSGVLALTRLPNGDVVAGGAFSHAGTAPASLVARWNGTAWAQLGAGLPAQSLADAVQALAVLPGGTLYAGGSYDGGSRFLASWNGTAWTNAATIGGGFNNVQVASLAAMPNGDLVVGGSFSWIGGVAAAHVARRSNGAWLPLGSGVGSASPTLSIARQVSALAPLPNGDLVATGNFDVAGGLNAPRAARWNGATWATLASGFDGWLAAVARLPNGDLVVGGTFLSWGSTPLRRIARWNGATWSPLGTGMDGAVTSLAVLGNGDLVATGMFLNAGGVPASRVARWNGSAWAQLGTGLGWFSAGRLLVLANGDLVATGSWQSGGSPSGIARWNGSTWSGFGSGVGAGGSVHAVAELPNGDLVAAGAFADIGGVAAANIARWNGSTWSPLGSGLDGSVITLAVLQNGDLAAGGAFTTAGGTPVNRVARWNGAAWSAMGNGLTGGAGFSGCSALERLPNGDLAASASFNFVPPGTVSNDVWRWNGSVWTSVAGGIRGSVAALSFVPTGELLVLGSFAVAGGLPTGPFARLASTCPAVAAASGTGCTGSGGLNTLVATALPLLGSTFRATATGLAPGSLAVAVRGVGSIAVPLSSLLAAGVPGCTLLASPDVLAAVVPNGGTATDQFVIPSSPTLVGVGLMHQLVPIEIDVGGGIAAVTSTNALALTIGAF